MAIYVRDENGVLQAWEIPAYKGEKGEAGITPNLQIGDVITLESGQQATITRRGDDENPIFDFAIPKGENGEDGIYVGRIEDAPSHAQIVVNDDASPYDLFFENANIDYMGKAHDSLKKKADSDIEYLLRKFGTQHYEGANITATDTYQKQVRSAVFKGVTKYRDRDTGEIVDNFQEGRNLELVSVKSPIVTVIGKNLIGECINPSERYRNYKSHLKPNTRYSLIYKNSDGSNTGYGEVGLLNGNVQVFLGYANAMYFTTPPSTNDSTLLYIDTWFKEISVLLAEGEINLYLNLRDILKEPYKSHTLTTPSDLELRGIGNTQDTLDLNTGEYIKRIETRPYQQGDESNAEVLTDKVNTVYKLAQPITTKIDLKGQKVYSYDGTTYYTTSSLEGHPAPLLSIDVPTNTTKMIARQREEIKQQEQKLIEQEEIQNLLIESQLAWFEQTVLLDNNQGIPSHIQKLYEVAYKRGIRLREEE